MSQITRLENPAAPARAATNRAIAIPQTGIIASGNLVPQQVLPPVSEGARLAAELGQDLGLIGDAAGTIRQYQDRQAALAARDAHEAERQAAHDRANAEAIATHERGQGALDAATKLPEIVQQIAEGKIAREGTSSAEQAKAIVDGLVKGQPDAYGEGFRRTAQDNVARALTGVDQRIIDDNKKALGQSAMSAAVLADTPEELDQAYRSAKVIGGISDIEAKSITYLAALQSAAKIAGTPEGAAKYAMIAQQMPAGMFAAEVQDAAAVAKAAVSQQAAQNYQNVANLIGDELADVSRDVPGASLARAQERLDTLGGTLQGHQRDQIQQLIDNRANEQLRKSQDQTYESIKRNILIGQFPNNDPGAAMDDIASRMYLDPKDTEYVPPSRAAGLFNTIRTMAKQDVGVARVGQFFSDAINTPGGGTFAQAPLTAADDNHLLGFYQKAGVINAVHDGEKITFMGVTDPLAFAARSQVAGRIPAQITSSLAAGLASKNQQQVQASAMTIGALAAQSPALVDGMDFGGDKLATARARFIAQRVREAGSPATATPQALAATIGPIAQEALAIDPKSVDYTPFQALGVIYFNNAEQSAVDKSFASTVYDKAREDIKAALKSDQFWKDQPWHAALPGWAGGVTIEDAPANVVETYKKALNEEFLAARTTMPEAQATAQAKKIATQRVLTEHPPMIWNGQLYFTGAKGQTFDPTMPDRIKADIMGLDQAQIHGDPKYTVPRGGIQTNMTQGAISLAPAPARDALRTIGAGGYTALPSWMFQDTAATVSPEDDRKQLWGDLKNNYIPVADPSQGPNRIVFRSKANYQEMKMIGTAHGVMPLVIDLSPPANDKGMGQRAVEALDKARAEKKASAERVAAAREAMANIPEVRRVGREMRQ